ncbi:hypothetical protein [Roseovarius tolerans]|uniref:hypothetical protein n=1 Tax=Roseovarius tolerans TaxID=74031 RepID=UPI00111383B7|nr:hypothetical protein [Roseovarius tolerans]
MIANIERQFLDQSDLREIHYYFGKHRPDNKMISHLKIQKMLGISIGAVILFSHFWFELLPILCGKMSFELITLMPWAAAILGGLYCVDIAAKKKANYEEFLTNSPGKDVDASDISYGSGHGHN